MTAGACDRPSLLAVANRAGVSPSTVSRALHNPEKLAPDTLERVRRAIEHTGYRPNAFASGLMRRSSRLIAVVTPDALDPVISRMLRGADDEARRLNYFLVLVPRSRLLDPGASLDAPALALADGVIALDTGVSAGDVASVFGAGTPAAVAAETPGLCGEAAGSELVRRVLARVLAPRPGGPVTSRRG